MLSLIDHGNSIDDHHFDAFGVLVRIVKAGAVGNRFEVEEDEIKDFEKERFAGILPEAPWQQRIDSWRKSRF